MWQHHPAPLFKNIHIQGRLPAGAVAGGGDGGRTHFFLPPPGDLLPFLLPAALVAMGVLRLLASDFFDDMW